MTTANGATKTCSKCGVVKSIIEFRKGRRQCNGCRKQLKAIYAKQYARRPEVKARAKQHRERNKDRINEASGRLFR